MFLALREAKQHSQKRDCRPLVLGPFLRVCLLAVSFGVLGVFIYGSLWNFSLGVGECLGGNGQHTTDLNRLAGPLRKKKQEKGLLDFVYAFKGLENGKVSRSGYFENYRREDLKSDETARPSCGAWEASMNVAT